MKRRPPFVLIAQIVLAIWSVTFGIALVGVIYYQEASLFHVQATLLQVVLPIAASVALVKRTAYARELALLSLACMWAYVLKGYWFSFGDRTLADLTAMRPVQMGFFIFLILLIILLPYIFGRLRWGTNESEYFEDEPAS